MGAFFVDLTVGTKAGQQTFSVIVDTGSSNTAVPAVGCSTCGQPVGYYNASASPSAAPLRCDAPECLSCIPQPVPRGWTPAPSSPPPRGVSGQWGPEECPYGPAICRDSKQCGFVVSYGGSSTFTEGTIVQDQVCLGGLCAERAFLDQITAQYPPGNMPQGIIGLAYPANACNPTCQPTILDSLVEAGQLKPEENLFGMCLTKANGGLLDLGYFNTSRIASGFELQWAPIVKEHWFHIGVQRMFVGAYDSGVPAIAFNIYNDAIGSFVDSGTSILLMSPAAFGGFTGVLNLAYADLPGLQQLLTTGGTATLNASQVEQYPPITFTIVGESGKDFNVTVAATDYLLPVMPAANGAYEYTLGVQGVASIGLILGDVIMQRYYIAFDRVGRRLGFAPVGAC